MRRKIQLIFLFVGIVILCSGCEKFANEEFGRYVEEEVTLSDDGGSYSSQANMLMVSLSGEDLVATDGSGIYSQYVDGLQTWKLITSEGMECKLEIPESVVYPQFYYGIDRFYMCGGQAIYQIDKSNGKLSFLTESTYYPLFVVADEERLYILHQKGVLLYDLREKSVAEKQDEVLSAFITERLEIEADGSLSLLFYPCGEEIYMLTTGGIYLHKLYDLETECLIDGGMYSISDIDKSFKGMAVTEDEGQNIFYVYYSDGKLMRYIKDEELPVEPEISLCIYSLHEDGNIRQAVSAFRQKYPELYVKYEVGMNPDYGITEEDALRNLSTELAAGTGPDILIMDDIDYENYVDKGILEDLSSFREQMSWSEYFTQVIDGFDTDNGLYVIPLTFAVPVLAGDAEKIIEMGKIENLSQLTDILEQCVGEEEQSIIGFLTEEEALRLFAQSSMGAWMTEEHTLNLEAIEEFLTQVKRIYDIQMKCLPEEARAWSFSGVEWGSGENTLARRMSSYGLSEALSVRFMTFPQQPYYAGYLSSAIGDYPLTVGKLEYSNGDYVLMPGQKYGACLPATLIAMNSASKNKEESFLFLEYIFSKEFQGNASLNGTPVNRNAYLEGQKNPEENSINPYAHLGYNSPDGTIVLVEVYWPSEETFAKLDSLMESVTGVNYCDNRVYEVVIDLGQAALRGESSIEETVDAIEEELEIYLAE